MSRSLVAALAIVGTLSCSDDVQTTSLVCPCNLEAPSRWEPGEVGLGLGAATSLRVTNRGPTPVDFAARLDPSSNRSDFEVRRRGFVRASCPRGAWRFR